MNWTADESWSEPVTKRIINRIIAFDTVGIVSVVKIMIVFLWMNGCFVLFPTTAVWQVAGSFDMRKIKISSKFLSEFRFG